METAVRDPAVIARLIAGRGRMRDGESLFLSGLLHSVGRLVFLARLPVECGEVLSLVRSGELSLNDAEVRVFGFSHAEVGAALLEGWGLPARLTLPDAVSTEQLRAALDAISGEIMVDFTISA